MLSGVRSVNILTKKAGPTLTKFLYLSTKTGTLPNQNSEQPTGDQISHTDLIQRIKIPPIKRTDESMDKMRSRLIYQSRKRGILETDLLLSGFASKYLKTMSLEELREYDELLNELDWDIYYWATKNFKISKIPDKWVDSKILHCLQDFAQNKNKEILKMPDLDKY
ncbi:succinate dehydrogenase assembly factor 2, mitochondrial [Monosporozyma unispora]|nr:succinate dehydrogenase assembly factor 2 [Kazachstania unispora]